MGSLEPTKRFVAVPFKLLGKFRATRGNDSPVRHHVDDIWTKFVEKSTKVSDCENAEAPL